MLESVIEVVIDGKRCISTHAAQNSEPGRVSIKQRNGVRAFTKRVNDNFRERKTKS